MASDADASTREGHLAEVTDIGERLAAVDVERQAVLSDLAAALQRGAAAGVSVLGLSHAANVTRITVYRLLDRA